MPLQQSTAQSPLGELVLLARQGTLLSLIWSDRLPATERHIHRHMGAWAVEKVDEIPGWSKALHAYFEGHPDPFVDLPLAPPGTSFQRTVWDALRRVPTGATCSYRMLAESIGRPTACRAVANANGKNPMPIVVPCHRVIASDGGLGGFSAGLDRKRWLLRHEGQAL